MAFGPSTGGGIGNALVGPPFPAPAAPAEDEQVGLWRGFRNKLRDDPNFRMSLLTAGLSMLQTPGPGESGFDTFSRGALTGVQTLDQLRQRDITRETVASKEEREDRKVAAIETTAASGTERNRLLGENSVQRAAQAGAALAEEKRQFDLRIKAGDFGPAAGAGAGSTGPERLVAQAKEAFLASEYYPRTEQGEGLAELRAQKLIGRGLVTPQDRFDFAAEFGREILLFNSDMDPEEAKRIATAYTNSLGDSFNEADPSTANPDANVDLDLVGKEAESLLTPGLVGTLQPAQTPGMYVIDYSDGTQSGELERGAALRALRAAVASRQTRLRSGQ